jgi:hypothetical protein
MTERKASATARAKTKAKEEVDPCGMTARKASAGAIAKATTGTLPLRQAQGQDVGVVRRERCWTWIGVGLAG